LGFPLQLLDLPTYRIYRFIWQARDLFGRRAYVDVDTLFVPEKSAAEDEKRRYHDDHKDHKYGYYACASSTTIVRHLVFSYEPSRVKL
jgi:hypothetical protein